MVMEEIDAVAYTRGQLLSRIMPGAILNHLTLFAGPGMYGCLSVGVHAARAIAAAAGKPLVGVHHMVRSRSLQPP